MTQLTRMQQAFVAELLKQSDKKKVWYAMSKVGDDITGHALAKAGVIQHDENDGVDYVSTLDCKELSPSKAAEAQLMKDLEGLM